MDVKQASEQSIRNKIQLNQSEVAGCYYCCNIFSPSEIIEWIDEGFTALCPKCSTDSVLGDASSYEINKETLKKLKDYWF